MCVPPTLSTHTQLTLSLPTPAFRPQRTQGRVNVMSHIISSCPCCTEHRQYLNMWSNSFTRRVKKAFHFCCGRLVILLFVVTTHRLSPHQGCDQPQPEERRQKMSLGAGRRKTEDRRQLSVSRRGRLVILLCSVRNNISLASLLRHTGHVSC